MINIENYIEGFSARFKQKESQPWAVVHELEGIIRDLLAVLDENYVIKNDIAIHKTAVIESNVILKAPLIIGKNCFIGANSYLRNGVILSDQVKIGTGCEIKSSIVFDKTSIAHFNFIGDSIIGREVNFEAGSITANHYNEREDKEIYVLYDSMLVNTEVHKFGSLVGDHSKIGANAVLSPGTILNKGSVVKRLELVEQVTSDTP